MVLDEAGNDSSMQDGLPIMALLCYLHECSATTHTLSNGGEDTPNSRTHAPQHVSNIQPPLEYVYCTRKPPMFHRIVLHACI